MFYRFVCEKRHLQEKIYSNYWKGVRRTRSLLILSNFILRCILVRDIKEKRKNKFDISINDLFVLDYNTTLRWKKMLFWIKKNVKSTWPKFDQCSCRPKRFIFFILFDDVDLHALEDKVSHLERKKNLHRCILKVSWNL